MANQHDQQAGGHHIVPFDVMAKVAGALLVLTVLTVVTAKFVHLGALAPLVAFTIAGAKAFMVMGYFMGLKYDVKSNRLIFGTGFAFLVVLFFFCALDIWTRVGQISTL